MSQLPDELENPLDTFFSEVCEKIAPFFYETGHSANMITTEGAVASGWGLYNLYRGNLPQFAAGYALGYFFDVLDGYFARRYKNVSKFGDLYEHGKDIATTAALAYLLYTYYDIPKPILAAFVANGAILGVHMAHQQRYLKKSGGFLSILEPLAGDSNNMKWTRWFGCGTFMLFSVALPFLGRRIA